MKLKYNFIVNKVADNYMAVPVGNDVVDFNGILKLNETAAFIIEQLNEEITYDALVSAVKQHFDSENSAAVKSVDNIVNVLKENNLLTE